MDKKCVNCRHFLPSCNFNEYDSCEFIMEFLPKEISHKVKPDWTGCSFFFDLSNCKNFKRSL